jgi:predicted ArsR family transcriptional regulator
MDGMDRPLEKSLALDAPGRVVAVLRRGPQTVHELARELGVTGNAVRGHLIALQRDGVVKATGKRRGPRKPSVLYTLSTDAEQQFSRLYAPVLTELLRVLDKRLARRSFDAIMRRVGRALVGDRPIPTGSVLRRAQAASALLNELGGHTVVEKEKGACVIRSFGCPLSAVTLEHPEACNAVESLLGEFTKLEVSKCCEREARLRCCFTLRKLTS